MSTRHHPQSRVIRPLRDGDIIAFPYLNAVGRYTGDDSVGSFTWSVPPGGPLSIGHLPKHNETDAMIDSGEIVILETEFGSLAAYHASRTYRDCDPRLVSPGGAPSTGHLSLRAERGSRVRERVNGFLKHPDVAYQHDPVTTPFRIALTATHQDREVAMAVLGRPRGRHNADGRTVELCRFAAHPDRPANTPFCYWSSSFRSGSSSSHPSFSAYQSPLYVEAAVSIPTKEAVAAAMRLSSAAAQYGFL